MSAYPAYSFGSAARKLDERPAVPSSPIEVIPGAGRLVQRRATSPILFLARVLIVGIVIFALIGVVRITLSSAAVACALETRELDRSISAARDAGSDLEVAQSTLSNPTRIKAEATELGMATPNDLTFFDMSGDVVVCDKAGNLLLSESVGAVLQASEA